MTKYVLCTIIHSTVGGDRLIDINLKCSIPIYEQIINSIKENVVKGYLKADDLLPSVRKLAAMLQINPNTVAKAYQELERQGITKTISGKGTFIASQEENKSIDISEQLENIRPALTQLMLMGVKKDVIIEKIENILNELEG